MERIQNFEKILNAAEPEATAPSFPISPLASLAGVAVDHAPGEGKRAVIRHARELLNELEALHRCLCLGEICDIGLQALAAKLQSRQACHDPKLADLLAQIEVRCAVELARYGS